MATHTPSTALTQLLQEPSLGSQKAAKPKAWGPWYAAKQLQLFNTHPPWHIWKGLLASRASKGSGNRHKPCSAKQTSLTIIPPAPGKHFPFVGDRQDVRRSTGHLHHLVAQQSLHNLGLAGEEQQPSAETSQPARLLPSLPPGPPRLNTALAASQFSSNTNNREISLFFLFQTVFKGIRDYMHAAQKIMQTSLGRKKAASTKVWRGKRFSRGWDSPPCPCGECQGL